jgi:hypothetical protein
MKVVLYLKKLENIFEILTWANLIATNGILQRIANISFLLCYHLQPKLQ